MAQIIGQIEPLKKIKWELNQKGIKRFNSIKEMQSFHKNYDIEKNEIIKQTENVLIDEIETLKARVKTNQEKLKKDKIDLPNKLNERISTNLKQIDLLQIKKNNNYIFNIFYLLKRKILGNRTRYLQNNFDQIISKSTLKLERKINQDFKIIDDFISNKQKIILKRSQKPVNKLEYTKKVVEKLSPLITGAIGENLVVKELEKLSDDNILINDFNVKFNPPIYNRNNNDRILSIQIDHLLISRAGIFILETKNWSKSSIESIDLRSPVEQIHRTSYALFVLINKALKSKKIKLKNHHWGDKKIPIRNIIAMINNKPKEKFKYVEIKLVNELYSYITYFNPVFSNKEVKRITKYLLSINN